MDATEIRYLTYSRGNICDRTIDTEYLQHDCPLDQTSSKTPSVSHMRNATASLGRFDQIPLETTQHILAHLDLSSLTLVRSTSKRMNLLVDSLHAYGKIVTHAPNALRALLSTQSAQYFTAIDLYNALRAQDCFLCGHFGAFLYLLTCRRCCWRCLTTAPDLLPISKTATKHLYRFSRRTMAKIPTILNIPGPYSPKQNRLPDKASKRGVRVALVAYGAARKACAIKHVREPRADDYKKAKLETRIALRGLVDHDFMRDMDYLNYDPAGYKAGQGHEPQRFMAAVRIPTLIRGTDAVEWGISCLGCLEQANDGDEEKFWNKQYTTEGMVKHLEHCQKARVSWAKDRVEELKKR